MATNLSITDLKEHLIIDTDFTEDDWYLQSLLDAAEQVVATDLDIKLESLLDDEGNLPQPIVQAIMLICGTWYRYRESVTTFSGQQLPHAYKYLLDLYHNYNLQK